MLNEGNIQQIKIVATLGRYQLVSRIGRGGMSEVWLAIDPRLNRQVAIKTLPFHNQDDLEYTLRFEREAQAVAALNHPHILPVHDYGKQQLPNGMVMTYIVMPYVAGGSLADKIVRYASANTMMPPQEALNYLSQAAEAIDYAHGQGIIHRDIKPGNMLLRDEGWLMLADFGIARIVTKSEQLTQTGTGFGTPEYMAPEQAQGHAVAASDIYSLGVLAYQLFTGRLPFQAETGYATIVQHVTMLPPPPRQINPHLSPAVEAALLRGLAKQPGERYPSCQVFVGELQRALSTGFYKGVNTQPMMWQASRPDATTVAGTRQTQANGQFWPNESNSRKGGITRRKVLIGIAATTLAVGGGLVGWAATHGGAARPVPGQSGTVAASQRGTPQSSSPNSASNSPLVIQGKHNKPVATLAFSPTGNNVLASAGDLDDGLVFLWDVPALYQQKGSQPREKASLRTQNVTAMLLAWSPLGDMLAIGNAGDLGINNAPITVYKSDLSDYAPGFSNQFGVQGTPSIEGLFWGPDHYIYAVAHPFNISSVNLNAQDQLYIWDPGHPQKALAVLNLSNLFVDADSNIVDMGNNKFVNLATNPLQAAPYDTTLLAMGTDDGIVLGKVTLGGKPAWSKTNTLTFNPNDQYAPAEVGAISWSHTGKLLAAIPYGLQVPKSVTVFDFQNHTFTTLDEPVENQRPLMVMEWCPSPSSTLVAAGTKDGRVYVWDYHGSTLPQNTLSAPQGVTGVVKALAWSPDGQWLAAAYSDANATIAVWKM